MAKPDIDPDAFIANLTPAQLDALNARQDARRAEIGAQPVFCPKCYGVGIEWHSGYGGSSDLSRCSSCRGRGYVPRSQGRGDAREWDLAAALAVTLESLAHDEFKMKVVRQGAGYEVSQPKSSGWPYAAQVTPLAGSLADFDLTITVGADRAKPGTYRISGTGELWHAMHYTCRGLAIDYRG